ncbi:putative t-SNARE coiled-coil homology domain-containing protein [Acanthamoeba castellanii mimivirus]|uniref:Putative t-SNARE coiled-coil homology domain-containing protein L657 n=5 Tax=Mimivirus TaxID=315393 RepID=YL657_MIMIV|nr:putative t-SNARE coiled-coil homology domain-containing protein [Acanthamoeba polyphaga mimivirus]Q5UR18.1 RecName: Full=Putative t-SNARE coiled-coil homology domain-containing protein L657 [Acanthamoeba polyphaga mimivirus]AHA45183.1 putative t-SNARE coiled-coil homology domain-containing protein [Hirudovirus strain Sangsue]AHJ40280.1 t-SNARE coiled-coil homology domain-containing protein [Samba virus]ALR84245.1 putative t-SNARE coiled-coil homology domain-containing protein [Niemeyer virus
MIIYEESASDYYNKNDRLLYGIIEIAESTIVTGSNIISDLENQGSQLQSIHYNLEHIDSDIQIANDKMDHVESCLPSVRKTARKSFKKISKKLFKKKLVSKNSRLDSGVQNSEIQNNSKIQNNSEIQDNFANNFLDNPPDNSRHFSEDNIEKLHNIVCVLEKQANDISNILDEQNNTLEIIHNKIISDEIAIKKITRRIKHTQS